MPIEVESLARDERADLPRCRMGAYRSHFIVSAEVPTPSRITDDLPSKSRPVSIGEVDWSSITQIPAASGSSAGIEVPGGPSSTTWILGVKRRSSGSHE